jgi:hypothetical protein
MFANAARQLFQLDVMTHSQKKQQGSLRGAV